MPDDDEELITVPRRGRREPRRRGQHGELQLRRLRRALADPGRGRARARSIRPAGRPATWRSRCEGDSGTLGTFAVAIFTADEREQVDEAVQIVAAVAVGVLLLGTILAFSIAGRVLAPLQRAARRRPVGLGHADGPADRGRGRRRDRRARAAPSTGCSTGSTVAFASQREFIRDVSHELRTPIAVSRGHLELLAEGHITDEATGGRRSRWSPASSTA